MIVYPEIVLFLDIDGVLAHSKSIEEALSEVRSRTQRALAQIDPDCARRLKRIVDETGCTLVLSSVWRTIEHDKRGLDRALQEVGFPRHFIKHQTPVILQKRHLEVSAWLKDHPEVTRYICLDDGIIEGHPTVLVRNGHFTGGLQDVHVEEAIRMLKDPA